MRRFEKHIWKCAGVSLLELVVVLTIILMLTAVASAGYAEMQLSARESAAILHIQTIQKTQAQFYSTNRRYAATLPELEAAGLIPEHLASGTLGGYRFELQIDTDSYELQARPERFRKSGRRSFYTSEALTIRQTEEDRRASVKDRPI